jgi:hypothetical protein
VNATRLRRLCEVEQAITKKTQVQARDIWERIFERLSDEDVEILAQCGDNPRTPAERAAYERYSATVQAVRQDETTHGLEWAMWAVQITGAFNEKASPAVTSD